MAALVIQITDGTTTINLDGSGDFAAEANWRPAIATRRRSRMGNQPRYTEVMEEIPVTIFGSDVDDLIANEVALVNLLDKAAAWYEGNDSEVLFKYRHQDSSLATAVQACILGPSDPPIEYIGQSFSYSNTGLYRQVYLRFYRRGEWLGAEDGDASSSTDNPGVMVATNTATALASPVRIQMTNYFPMIWGQSYFILSDADAGDIVTANTATASGFTSVVGTGLPFDTNVLRYTPASTAWATSGTIDMTLMLQSATKKIGIFANIRKTAATGALVKGVITAGMLTGEETKETRPIALRNDGYPQWHYLGNINLSADLQKLTVCDFAISIKASVASGTVDIDAFHFVDLDAVQIVGLLPNSIHSDLVTLGIDNRLDSHPFPIVYHIDGDSTVTTTANGDLMLTAQAAAVNVVWLSNGEYSGSKSWCAVDPGSGARLSNVLTAVRRPAYLVPQ